MIFKSDDIKNILDDCEFYNFPDGWTSNGVVIWHKNAYENNMVIIRGENGNAGVKQEYLPDIIDKISAILTPEDNKYEIYNKPVVKIKDFDKTLNSFAQYSRNKFNGKVIAVTGSCGKTTCTSIINNIFEKFGSDINRQANTFRGISWEITNFNPDSKYWVIESSLGGRMLRSSNLLRPDYAVITNIAPVHLEEWQEVSFIARKKSEIFDAMKEGSVAVLYNEMDKFEMVKQAALSKKLRIITFGEKNSDAIINCRKDNNYIEYLGEKYILKESIISKHIMLDMAAAIIIAKSENTDKEHVCEILNKFECLTGRGKVIRVEASPGKFITVTDEAYNANPVSMKFSLEAFGQKGYKSSLLILGDMLEGGKETINHHLELEQTIRAVNPSRILFCGTVIKGLWEVLKSDYPCAYYDNYKDLNKDVFNWIENGDGVFVKGSHSIGLSKTVDLLTKGK